MAMNEVKRYEELKQLAEAATPQNFDSAEQKVENGYIECPHCGGSGEVEMEADYCNYDNAAIGWLALAIILTPFVLIILKRRNK